jgi:hypothetical protein
LFLAASQVARRALLWKINFVLREHVDRRALNDGSVNNQEAPKTTAAAKMPGGAPHLRKAITQTAPANVPL